MFSDATYKLADKFTQIIKRSRIFCLYVDFEMGQGVAVVGVSLVTCWFVSAEQTLNVNTENQKQAGFQTTLPRLNFGVVFRLERTTHLVSHLWWHSFFIELPNISLYLNRNTKHLNHSYNNCATFNEPQGRE
jgi:hypothetical protein